MNNTYRNKRTEECVDKVGLDIFSTVRINRNSGSVYKKISSNSLFSFFLIESGKGENSEGARKTMECRRPNRSDVHASLEEQAKIEEDTREYFDEIAPKRHTKPQRSDYSSHYTDAASAHALIPELSKFQHLEAQDSQKLVYNGSEATEEYVETEYYEDLNCVGDLHHTTGTGFIKMEKSQGNGFTLTPDSQSTCHASCKGNPATNDWIPAAATDEVMNWSSDKPQRSEN